MSAGGPPPLYQFRGSKQNAMAFSVHTDRIFRSTVKKLFVQKPGQTYIKVTPESEIPYIQKSLSILCEHYGLEPAKSFRQASMSQHFEIMGDLLSFYNRKFMTEAELALHADWIRDHSVKQTFAERPGQTYLLFKEFEPAKIEEALKKVCDYHQLDYSESFRQSRIDNNLYQIKGKLLELYTLHHSSTIAEPAPVDDAVSPSRIKCR